MKLFEQVSDLAIHQEDEDDMLLLQQAAEILEAVERLGLPRDLREGTAANWLAPRLPVEPFTAQDIVDSLKMNLRTVQQAIVDLRAAGIIKPCGVRRRESGKGRHPCLYTRCE